jgi:hypothetical protein
VHLVARKKKDFVVETLLNALDAKLQYLRENMVATLLLQSSSCYGGEEVRSKESGAFMSLITYTIMYRPCRVQDPCSDLEEPPLSSGILRATWKAGSADEAKERFDAFSVFYLLFRHLTISLHVLASQSKLFMGDDESEFDLTFPVSAVASGRVEI